MITFELLTKESKKENALDNYGKVQNIQRVYRKINNKYYLLLQLIIGRNRKNILSYINEVEYGY